MRRNLGDEVFERLIEPFCSGCLHLYCVFFVCACCKFVNLFSAVW